MDIEKLKEVARAYNQFVEASGKQSQEQKKQWFNQNAGYSLRTFQDRVKEAGADIKANRSTGLYEIGSDNEPIKGQITLEQASDKIMTPPEAIGEPYRADKEAPGQVVEQEATEPPKDTTEPEKVRTALYLEKELLKAIKIYGLQTGTTFNAITRELLQKFKDENIK